MDQDTLVTEQIDGGRKLLARMADAGFPITAAFWAKTSDDDRWYLYVASPQVEAVGSLPLYPIVRRARTSLDGEWASAREVIEPFTVKLVETADPMVQEVLAAVHRYGGGPFDTWYRTTRTRDGGLTGTYIYTRLPVPAVAPAAG